MGQELPAFVNTGRMAFMFNLPRVTSEYRDPTPAKARCGGLPDWSKSTGRGKVAVRPPLLVRQ
jgi:hypothetical protein